MQPFNHFGLALFASVASLALAGEIGLRLGRRHRGHSDAEGRSQISMVEGALLGLLALLLGFTFSMAAGRYDVRQELVTREANAIGTVALRSDFLPEASRKAFRNTLLAYAEIRMEFVRAGVNEEELAKALETANRLEAELWTAAMETTRPGSWGPPILLVTALNDLFDLRESRMSALHNRVPLSIWIVLYVVAGLAMGALGLGSGLTGRRITLSIHLMPILLAVILTLLVDLDHPRKGLIRVSQDSMVRVIEGLKRS